jgi:integrase
MTVWKSGDRASYRYLFYIEGKAYRGNTKQITKADAEEWEERERRRVRRELAGLPMLGDHAPTFDAWSTIYLKYLRQRGKVRRIDRVEDLLRVVLRFWGSRPKKGAVEGEPYHGLTLADPIRDPEWIERFEEWIRNRKTRAGTDDDGDPIYRQVGAQQRLHYMSVMSRMYRVARLPRFRKKTGVTTNPFLEIERDKPPGRKVTVTPAELRRWLAHAPKHAQLAIAIAALAPKLRKENVLELHWERSFDPALQFITVHEHKQMGTTKQPMVIAIGRSLRKLLKAAREQRGSSPWVITYRGKPVKSIRGGVKASAVAAGLTYGRDVAGGVTFHTIRHTAATLLAEVPGLNEKLRSESMGQDIQTTQAYTHLRRWRSAR